MSTWLFIFTGAAAQHLSCRLSRAHNFSSSSGDITKRTEQHPNIPRHSNKTRIKTHYMYFSFIYIFAFVTYIPDFRLLSVPHQMCHLYEWKIWELAARQLHSQIILSTANVCAFIWRLWLSSIIYRNIIWNWIKGFAREQYHLFHSRFFPSVPCRMILSDVGV